MKVRTGIDRILDGDFHSRFAGKRIGLICGASGLSRDFRMTADILHDMFRVTALFAPEHGARGVLAPGEKVRDGVDAATGLPVYSLFEDFIFSVDENQRDSAYMPQALAQTDLLVFDMQDVGSRYFTYVSTLFYCMKACGQRGIPLVVLDRPNPIGGTVQGNTGSPELSSFIGLTRVPIRHGMTVGELARYYNGEYGLMCPLTVVTLDGWNRGMFYTDTGLPFVKPSPNLPTMDAITVYNGTCLFAGTNVSEGRGTTTPFTTVGAPYICPEKLARELNALHIPGIAFSPAYFIPQFSKYAGQVVYGVQLHLTDARILDPVSLGVRMMRKIQEMYPQQFAFTPPKEGNRWHIDLASGTEELRLGPSDPQVILERWQREAQAFLTLYEKYRLYD